jgi:hypothetical protein
MSFLKDLAEASDAWINVAIKVAIIALIGAVLFYPHDVPILRRVVVKSSEINIEGVKFQVIDAALTGKGVDISDDGRLLIGGVDVSTLPDDNAKLRQTVSDLNAQIVALNTTINTDERLLRQASGDLSTPQRVAAAPTPSVADHPTPSASPSLESAPAVPPPAASPHAELAKEIAESVARAVQQQAAAQTTVAQAAEVVAQSTPLPGVGFGIVFGADATPQAAMDEVRKVAKQATSGNPIILYKRQGSWRSVLYFGTQEASKAQLPNIKSVKPQSYLVNISTWCPTPILIAPASSDLAEQKDCQF